MKTSATLWLGEMGRRDDDFSADIIDEAVLMLKTVGFEAAEAFLDANLIDFEITRRVLSDQPQRRRSADTTALVRFDADDQRRRLNS
jgi:hypothetical protein